MTDASPAPALIGILTVSDRASRGEYADEGGPAIRAYLHEVLSSPWAARERIVSDDLDAIVAALRGLADEGCCLAPAPRPATSRRKPRSRSARGCCRASGS
jgi:molybdopterin adenylyltransferase